MTDKILQLTRSTWKLGIPEIPFYIKYFPELSLSGMTVQNRELFSYWKKTTGIKCMDQYQTRVSILTEPFAVGTSFLSKCPNAVRQWVFVQLHILSDKCNSGYKQLALQNYVYSEDANHAVSAFERHTMRQYRLSPSS